MSLPKLKKELQQMPQQQLIDLLCDMYNKVPAAKDFLELFVSVDIEKLAEKYKKQIARDLKIKFDGSVRDVSARKLIRDLRKMGIDELSIELELFYVEYAFANIEEASYWEAYNYIDGMHKMFYEALEKIEKNNLEEKYNLRISELQRRGGRYGYFV